MKTKKKLGRVGTYRDATDGTERCMECGETTDSGRCTCNDVPITAAQRRANAAAKSGAVMRAAGHTPEQLAERSRCIDTIVGHQAFAALDRDFFGHWECSRLRDLAAEIRDGSFDKKLRGIERAKAAAAERQRDNQAILDAAAEYRARQLEEAPASVVAAAEKALPELESEFPVVQRFGVARVRRAAAEHRHQEARKAGRDPRQDAADEARFEVAKEQLESHSSAVRQLGEKTLRRLKGDSHKGRDELLASIRGSKVAALVHEADLRDCSLAALQKLEAGKDSLAGAGYTIGTVKASAKQNRADKKRNNR